MVDSSDNVSLGGPDWRDAYIAQGDQKRAQIEQMIRYAESSQCRMSSLIRHFGDVEDGLKPCGICDFCAPADCIAQRFREPTEKERLLAWDILDTLRLSNGGRSIGKLHSELCPNGAPDRDQFEELVGSLARAGLLRLTDAVFEKDGRQIPFRKASLTRDAEYVDEDTPLELSIKDAAPVAAKARRKKKAVRHEIPVPREVPVRPVAITPPHTEEVLRAWRLTLAKRQGVPAFRIMTDKVLGAIARNRPRTAAELLAIPGIGIGSVEKYGAQIYRILNETRD
jgi:superfamily II DNA helicase RecQ